MSFLSNRPPNPELPQLKELMPRCSLDRIIEVVADAIEETTGQILAKGRAKNTVRGTAIYFSKINSGKPGIEIAQLFGLSSESAITMRYNQALIKIEARRDLNQKIRLIK